MKRYVSLARPGELVRIDSDILRTFSLFEDGKISTESCEFVRRSVRIHRWSVAGGGWWIKVGETGEYLGIGIAFLIL